MSSFHCLEAPGSVPDTFLTQTTAKNETEVHACRVTGHNQGTDTRVPEETCWDRVTAWRCRCSQSGQAGPGGEGSWAGCLVKVQGEEAANDETQRESWHTADTRPFQLDLSAGRGKGLPTYFQKLPSRALPTAAP